MLTPLSKSKLIKLLACSLVTLGLILACAGLKGAAQVEILDAQAVREQVMPCIPDNPPGFIKEVEIAGQAEVDGTTYYYFYAYQSEVPENPENPDDPTAPNYEGYPSNLVISVTDGTCSMDHFNPMNDPIPLAQTLEQEVARLLTLDRYQRTIEQIGRDGLQARIDSWAEDPGVNGTTLWDEEQWALEQLGMDIPESLIGEK